MSLNGILKERITGFETKRKLWMIRSGGEEKNEGALQKTGFFMTFI